LLFSKTLTLLGLLLVEIFLSINQDNWKSNKYQMCYIPQSVETLGGSAEGGTSAAAVEVPVVPEDHMCGILSHLEQLFICAVRRAYPQHTGDIKCPLALGKKADYQCNVALSLSKVIY